MIKDFTFNEYKSALSIQLKYKTIINNLHNINESVKYLNNIIYEILNNINYKFNLELINKNEYDTCIEKINLINLSYKNINIPVTLNIFKKYTKIELEYIISTAFLEIKKFCLKYGCLSIISFLKLFHNNFEINSKNYNILNFYNNFFIIFNIEIINNKKIIKDIYHKNNIENINNPFETDYYDEKYDYFRNLNSISLYYNINNKLYKINGSFKEDNINISHDSNYLKDKVLKIKNDLKYLNIDNDFKNNYFNQINIKDLILLSSRDITHEIKNGFNELINLKNMSLSSLVKLFVKGSDEKQRYILTLLLLDSEENKVNATVIFDLISNDVNLYTSKPSSRNIYNSLHNSIKKQFMKELKIMSKNKYKIKNITFEDIDYETKINNLNCSDKIKSKAYEKLKEISGNKESSIKAQVYLDNLLKIPFNNYKKELIISKMTNFKIKLKDFNSNFKNLYNNINNDLNNSNIDGKDFIKNEIENIFNYYDNIIDINSENSYNNYITLIKKSYTKFLLFIIANNRKKSFEKKYNYKIDDLVSNNDNNDIDNIITNCILNEINLNINEKINQKDNDNEINYCEENNKDDVSENEDDENENDENEDDEDEDDEDEDDEDDENKDENEIINKKFNFFINNNNMPKEALITSSLQKLNHYKNIKETLLKMDGLTENNINLLREKINEIEINLGIISSNNNNEHILLKDNYENNVFNFIEGLTLNLIELYEEFINFKEEKINYIQKCQNNLDNCVHGHENSKKSILRLIGQWINGKNNGTCIGLCGPPGIGKTTICKNGLAKCLVNENGESRPIAFVALGGATNGSILEGHSYTYLGSTWGKIVDILIETQCMNPIIYIDELDKISNTEHGREITGILTHITDKTQNMEFEDKYFSGIKLDLSKVLFVFSYNDSSKIDKILRDRITEININPLSKNDKMTITKKYVFPEILETVGFNNNEIIINNNIIEHIIDKYTYEAGVRKLNDILYDLVRELNLKKIMNNDNINFPYNVDIDFINELMIDKPEINLKKISDKPMIGLINGMYATSSGIGGITIIQVNITPSDKKIHLEKLTGSQGDVMKESMNCALTVAWNSIPNDYKEKMELYCGLHIHCPDTSTPKDGPSAGTAITLAIISSLCKIPILNTIAITGEIDLLGNVHKIGGVDAKINGAILAGVTKIFLPEENRIEYNKYYNDLKKNYNEEELKDIIKAEIIFISHISDTFEHVFINNNIILIDKK